MLGTMRTAGVRRRQGGEQCVLQRHSHTFLNRPRGAVTHFNVCFGFPVAHHPPTHNFKTVLQGRSCSSKTHLSCPPQISSPARQLWLLPWSQTGCSSWRERWLSNRLAAQREGKRERMFVWGRERGVEWGQRKFQSKCNRTEGQQQRSKATLK